MNNHNEINEQIANGETRVKTAMAALGKVLKARAKAEAKHAAPVLYWPSPNRPCPYHTGRLCDTEYYYCGERCCAPI